MYYLSKVKPMLASVLGMIFWNLPVQGRDLTDVIPSLYGGDGITLAGGSPMRASAFTADSLSGISGFATGIAANFTFPIPTTQAGFTYKFDPITNEFVKKSRSGGPIFSQRAETIGKNRLNFGFAFTYLEPTKFEGQDLDNLDIVLTPVEAAPQGDRIFVDLDVEVQSQIFTFYGTYGLTDRIEVGYVLPFFRNSVSAKAKARFEPDLSVPGPTPTFNPAVAGDGAEDSASETKFGIGDFHIRAKWHWLDSRYLQIATGIEVRFPTGKEDNLMGGRGVGMRPTLIASGEFPIGEGTWSPRLNIGYKFKSGQDRLVYAAGVEYGRFIKQHHVTFILDLLAEQGVDSKNGIGDDIFDVSVGVKWNLSQNSLLYMNVIVPLNKDEGLRPDAIPTAGFEIVF